MNALLPSGLYDMLPPEAACESSMVRTLLDQFSAYGYHQVNPPLLEYEQTLLQGGAQACQTQSFRVMDPVNQQMMALRADMTMQIARIAGNLMSDQPRPLRLSYAGQTIRTTPDTMRASRQFRQVGIECFGSDALSTDIEVIQVAASAINALGLSDLSIDLNMSSLLDNLTETMDQQQKTALFDAIKRKDHQAIKRFNVAAIDQLIQISGNADDALTQIEEAELPESAAESLATLKEATEMLRARLGDDISITIDPLELQGFGYYSGISFSIYLKEQQSLAGRGGRYRCNNGESATGFTLYTEDLVSSVPAPEEGPQILVPATTSRKQAEALQQDGYQTLYATTEALETEAKQLGCSHIFDQQSIKQL